MKFEIIPESSSKLSYWSGGSTKELFILPKDAAFSSGNFDVRLSIATVEVEESIFTSLPEVERTLMVLEGDLMLSHEDHYTVHLNQGEQDSFSGNWKTKSKGKVTDFNLMTKGDFSCSLEYITLKTGENIELTSQSDFLFIHVFKGVVAFSEHISEKSSLFFSNKTAEIISLKAVKDSVLIKVSITQ